MKRRDQIRSLDTLVNLRSLEVDKLQTELARQEATRARYATNLARMDSLVEHSGASGKESAGLWAPALALNCGQYKQAVFTLRDSHRTDLQLHEANMAVSQRNLAQAWTRRELLGKVLEQQQDALAREQDRVARKREDDIATQSWLAGRA
ncbi:flagellar export protein FliJ [Massilia jejuensis]|uniref:Flagellar FliJ protein n=1 Tax=Massilia jejuensis TaxID=648894 RepID=A0ABW0PD40_9BURK